MKILFVTPFLASPPESGGQRRLEGLMRGLSNNHEVSVLSLAEPGSNLDAMRDYCKEVVCVPHDVMRQQSMAKRVLQVQSLASRRSFEYLNHYVSGFQRQLDRMIESVPFDVVQFEFAQMGIYQLRRRATGTPIYVLDEHNIEYEIVKRTAEAEVGVARRLYSALNWRKLRSEEIDAWRRFDGIALTSARDAELLRVDLPSARTLVAPNAVDLDAFRPNDTQVEPNTLLFLGALDYHPNVDGVEYFLDEVLPLIVQKQPSVRVWIVGRNPPKSLLARQRPEVQFTGYVDDPREYLDRAAIAIVPLKIGGGTRFKIVEAMAKAKPIVSTSIGAEGLDAQNNENILLGDTPDEFSRAVCSLLSDHALAERLARSARAFAEARYGWGAVISKLESFYDELGARGAFVHTQRERSPSKP